MARLASLGASPDPVAKKVTAVEGVSVNAQVYEAIKTAILSGQLRPGVKLIHQELAQRLAVSRTPVRESLERLYQEGFVTRIARRGFFVAEIDEDEARELYELREALELFALRLTTVRGLSSADLRGLESFNKRYRQLLRDDSTRERMLVDRDWHLSLAALANNRVLIRMLESVFERLILKIRVDGYRTVRGQEALNEHLAMTQALRDENWDSAQKLLTSHIRGARRRLVSHLADLAD